MEKIETKPKTKVKGSGIKILLGSGIALVVTLISLLIISVILTYSDVSENIITVSVIVISALSIFIGSIISAVNINKNGILNGSLVGAIYMITIYLLSSIFVSGFSMNMQCNCRNPDNPYKWVPQESLVLLFKEGEELSINLEKFDEEDKTRVLDFLFGAAFALGGSLKKTGENSYLMVCDED